MASSKPGTSKDRTSNFNKDEAAKLTSLLRDYPIITSKKTDCASNQQKEAAWRSLAETFNSDASIYRNVKQLQQKFNNMKKTARKEMSAEKSGRRQTGGGPPPPKPSETTEWLNAIMGESISGLPAVYDDDALGDDDTTINTQSSTTTSIVIDFKEDDELCHILKPLMEESIKTLNVDRVSNNIRTEADRNKCDVGFDSSTPQALIRKPISRQLTNSFNTRKRAYTPVETRKRIIAHFDKKNDVLCQKKAREEELNKFAQEEHMQNIKERREMHQRKILLMEEKHLLFIEQQKEIHTLEIEFKKRMHELELEKAKLEIENIRK